MTSQMLRELMPGLWLFEDTCNVYVIKHGDRALLIDFGSGAVLDHLGAIGVNEVDWILHTHHHRDQCQGDKRANELGIAIAVPAEELHLFEEVEAYWDSRQLYHLMNVRTTHFTLAASVRTAAVLRDYDTFRWNGHALRVAPTPGHTPGHVALVLELAGKLIAFSGDLIHAPASMLSFGDVQWYYGGEAALHSAVYSLDRLRTQGVELFCPSHGAIISDAPRAALELTGKIRDYLREQRGQAHLEVDDAPIAVLPHLIQLNGIANSWIVLSDSGKALFVDYGLNSWRFLPAGVGTIEMREGNRFLEHGLEALRNQFGVTRFDAAIPSHYHDDHIAGFPYLQQQHGTQMWCFEGMRDVLEHPHAYNLACLSKVPLRIDRSIGQGERIRWEEYEFQVFHAPGHTDYHMAMFGTIDGRRVAFSGDNVHRHDHTHQLQNSTIPRNHLHADSHEITSRLFLEHEPEVACSGHNPALWLQPEDWRQYHAWAQRERRHLTGMAPRGDVEAFVFPDVVTVCPYQLRAAPGQRLRAEVCFTNTSDADSTLHFTLHPPAGITLHPTTGVLHAHAGERVKAAFALQVDAHLESVQRRRVLTLDATIDGRRRGEIAEAVVDLRPDLEWGQATRTQDS